MYTHLLQNMAGERARDMRSEAYAAAQAKLLRGTPRRTQARASIPAASARLVRRMAHS